MHRIRHAALVALLTVVLPAVGAANPGQLDPAFGTGGVVTTTVTTGSAAAAVALQADGKVVVAGQSAQSGSPGGTGGDLTVARYDPNGALDATFGNGGIVVTPILGRSAATGLAVQPDGKIVVVGSASADATNWTFVAVRYESDGTLDAGFGTGGIVTTSILDTAQAHGVVLQPDGKIVVAGFAGTTTLASFALARYATDGTLDGTFGIGGIVVASSGVAYAVALQADGKIVAAGTTKTANGADFAIARYDGATGALDPSFGSGGVATTTFGGTTAATASGLAVQPDGKLVVAGYAVNPSESAILARYQTDGSLDAGFGTAGIVGVAGTATTVAAFEAVRYQPPGWLVAVGGFGNVLSIHPIVVDTNFLVARFAVADGTPDFVVQTNRNVSEVLSDVVVQPDTRIVAAGASGGQIALARYLTTTCGDGVQEGSELCDDGNTTDGDGCDSNCVPTGCGNGVVTAGEACDDGNTENGDCCSATCQIETSGNACPDDGNPCTDDLCNASAQCTHPPNDALTCDDGDLCTTNDRCSGGACTATPVTCLACDGCDAGTGNCVAAPAPVCSAPLVAGKARLQLRDAADDAKDGLLWQWAHGPNVPVASFGFPAEYTLCVYSGGPTPTLLGRASSRGGLCSGKGCWRSAATGWNYKDPDGMPDGIASIALRAGQSPKGKLKVKGKGANLPLPTLPLSLPVRVQLRADTGSCWEATYSAAGMQKNDAASFKGKSD